MRRLRTSGLLLLFPVLLVAAEQDAIAIDNTLRNRHLPYGTVLDPVLGRDGSIVSYTRCGDSAIWTGHYLAAEAFRYRTTGAPQALENIRAALAGITRLIDVTGRDVLARCAIPGDSPYRAGIANEERAHGVFHATLDDRQWVWIGHTSRDQYMGVFFGLAAAYDLVPDPEIRAGVTAQVTRLLGNLMSSAWNIVMPDGTISTTFLIRPDQQLTLLQIGKYVNPSRFAAAYTRAAGGLAYSVALPLTIDSADAHSSYFKFNLAFINLFHLIRLETDPSTKNIYEDAFRIVRSTTTNHRNAHFNMIDRALHGPNASRDAETVADLDAWLTRPRVDVLVDLRGKVKACGENQACQPIPVAQRSTTDFLWQRSPFQLYGGHHGRIESAGIDYLLPYWMARYYSVIQAPSSPQIEPRP